MKRIMIELTDSENEAVTKYKNEHELRSKVVAIRKLIRETLL